MMRERAWLLASEQKCLCDRRLWVRQFKGAAILWCGNIMVRQLKGEWLLGVSRGGGNEGEGMGGRDEGKLWR